MIDLDDELNMIIWIYLDACLKMLDNYQFSNIHVNGDYYIIVIIQWMEWGGHPIFGQIPMIRSDLLENHRCMSMIIP